METAEVTVLAAFRIPLAMLPTRSEPQEVAEEITLDTAVLALVNAFVIAFLMLAAFAVMAESIF